MKKIITAIGATLALSMATPAVAETYGIFEVEPAEQGSSCSLGAVDGTTTLLMILDGRSYEFAIVVGDPSLSVVHGKLYPFVITLDDETFMGKAIGINNGGIKAVMILYNNPEVVYSNLRDSSTIKIQVGGVDLVSLRPQQDFDQALDALVICTARQLKASQPQLKSI